MTRFARASGSKSSNKRSEEEATSWEDLKQNKTKGHKRRKEHDDNVKINGKSVDITYFEGFPVKKDDAKRLKQLKKDLKLKGVPESEIFNTIKSERRKAEKALSREKKKVCFNCRQSGHVLNECPDLTGGNTVQNQETGGIGVCFKCGSTEHSSFSCKVVKSDKFKFALCFICKEQGHIAKQCPNNNSGIYPNGGCCRNCGSVTHLKKDCPTNQLQQEQTNIVLDTIDNSDPNVQIEALDGQKEPSVKVSKKKIKVIKM